MKSLDEKKLGAAMLAAKMASMDSYSPYSHFSVGAAIVTEDGTIFSGCNIENASYGLTICAERNAIFQAVSNKHRLVLAVVVYTPTDKPTAPCGACRQVINEFAEPDTRIISICDSNQRLVMSMSELLPNAFGPKNLI